MLLVTYILRDDRVGKAACQVLADAARRGVRVSILLDSIGSWNPGVPEMVAQLREAGASVSVINPLLGWTALRINNRCHVKLTVIDGSIGYVAGLNLSEKYAGGGLTRDQWRDTAIRVQGPVVEDIAAVFRHLEQESGRGFNRHRIPMPFVEETRRAIQEHVAGKGPWPPQNTAHEPTPMPSARVIFTRPGWFSHEFYKAMLLAVNSATESITMEYGYFIPDHPMTLALRNAAHRGVKVRIIMPDRLDVYLSKKISLESAQKLVRQGIELYAYTPGLLHSKTIVIDSMWSATGSANLNGRSFLLNYECTVAVLDPEFARQTLDVLDYDIMHCRKLSERDLLPANPLQFLVHKLLFFLKDHL